MDLDSLSEVEPVCDYELFCFFCNILLFIIELFAIAIDIVVTFDLMLSVVPLVELSIVSDLHNAIDENDTPIVGTRKIDQ